MAQHKTIAALDKDKNKMFRVKTIFLSSAGKKDILQAVDNIISKGRVDRITIETPNKIEYLQTVSWEELEK